MGIRFRKSRLRPALAPAADTPGAPVGERVVAEHSDAATLRRVAPHLLVVACYVALGFILCWPIWRLGAATNMQPAGDQWRNVWFGEWDLRALTNFHSLFFSHAVNYPGGVNMLVATGQPLLVVLAPVTALFGPIATFNLVITLAPAAAAAAAYLLLRRYVSWTPAAFLGGLLFGFGPPVVIHDLAGQENLSFTAFVPLILLALDHVIVRETTRERLWGILLALAVVAQFLVSPEFLVDTAVVAVVAVIVVALVRRDEARERLRHAARGLAWAAGLAVVLLAWPAWDFVAGAGHVSGAIQLIPEAYRSDLIAPVVPDSAQLLNFSSLLSTADRFSTAVSENGVYLGVPLLLLLAAGVVWCRRNAAVVAAAVGGALAFLLSLGADLAVKGAPAIAAGDRAAGRIPLPEAILHKLPLLGNLVPGRFALLMDLCAAVILAIVVDRVRLTLSPKMQSFRFALIGSEAAAVGLAVVALLPLLPAHQIQGVTASGAPVGFIEAARAVPQSSVAVAVPFPSGKDPEAELWQAEVSIRFYMPGGSFFVPQGSAHHVAYNPALGYTYDSLTAVTLTDLDQGNVPSETTQLRQSLFSQWQSWRVRSFLAVPSATANPVETSAFLKWLLGPPQASIGSTEAWYTSSWLAVSTGPAG